MVLLAKWTLENKPKARVVIVNEYFWNARQTLIPSSSSRICEKRGQTYTIHYCGDAWSAKCIVYV